MANQQYLLLVNNTHPHTGALHVSYYIADTDAGKPVTGLNVGDLCYAVDTKILYISNSATTWNSNVTAASVLVEKLRILSSGTDGYAEFTYGGAGLPDVANITIPSVDSGTMAVLTTEIGDSTIASGTYTPTLTNVTNLAASTAYQCQYLRVGRTVTVSGRVDVDPTLGLATELGISLPIASDFGATEDCGGAAFATGIAGQGAGIRGDAANNRAAMAWVAADITNQPMYFTFAYQVI